MYPLEEWYEARGIFAPSTPFTCLTAVRTGTCNVGRSCTGEQIQPIGRTKNSLQHRRARNKARRPRGEGVQLQAMHKRYLALQSLWHLVTHGVSHRQHEGMKMWTCVLRMKRRFRVIGVIWCRARILLRMWSSTALIRPSVSYTHLTLPTIYSV